LVGFSILKDPCIMMRIIDAMMQSAMRTTVDIDVVLLAEVKALAARRQRTVSELVDDALRAMLAGRAAKPGRQQRIALPTDGGSGLQPGVDLEDKEALAELLGDNQSRRAAR
jgi:hypothetical protein